MDQEHSVPLRCCLFNRHLTEILGAYLGQNNYLGYEQIGADRFFRYLDGKLLCHGGFKQRIHWAGRAIRPCHGRKVGG